MNALVVCILAGATSLGLAQSPPDRPPKPPVIVFGANTGKVGFSNVASPDVNIPFTVENTSGQMLKDISIEVPPFTSAGGEVVEAKIQPANVRVLPPQGTTQFTLVGKFLSPATFSAHARVLQGKKAVMSFDIEIARTKAKPPIDIGDIAAVQETADLARGPLDIPLTVKLYTSSTDVRISPPILQSVVHKRKVDSASGSAASATLDVSSLPNSLEVKADKPLEITARLKGITAPGRYDVKLRFAPAGYEAIEKDVTIYVRDSGWIAAAFIFAGVLLSLFFQAYGGTIRPRLFVQRRVESVFASLREMAANASEDGSRQLVTDATNSLRDRWNRARGRGGLASATVDVYEQMIPGLRRWIEMRSLVAATRPKAVQQRLLEKLLEAADAFRAVNADAAKIATAIETLQSFPETIRKETMQELKAQLDALDRELRTDARPAATRLRSELLLVREKLDGHVLEEGIRVFDAARLQYAALLANNLVKRVESKNPPIGIDSKDWGLLVEGTKRSVADVLASSDADDAMSKVAVAMKKYLFSLADALRTAAGALGDTVKAKVVTDAIDAAQTAINENRLTAAWQQMDAATTAYRQASVPVGRQMGATEKTAFDLLDVLAGGGADVGTTFGMMGAFAVPPAADLMRLSAPARTTRQLNRFDLLASAVALAVATGIGLQTVWVDNPVWGGGALYFAAFIWGFAVDQFTHAGIVALRPR